MHKTRVQPTDHLTTSHHRHHRRHAEVVVHITTNVAYITHTLLFCVVLGRKSSWAPFRQFHGACDSGRLQQRADAKRARKEDKRRSEEKWRKVTRRKRNLSSGCFAASLAHPFFCSSILFFLFFTPPWLVLLRLLSLLRSLYPAIDAHLGLVCPVIVKPDWLFLPTSIAWHYRVFSCFGRLYKLLQHELSQYE